MYVHVSISVFQALYKCQFMVGTLHLFMDEWADAKKAGLHGKLSDLYFLGKIVWYN